MESILQQLYEGKISPAEQYRPRTEEHREAVERILKSRGEFARALKETDQALYEKFLRIMEEDDLSFETGEMFIDGFKLGARMMLEIMNS
ncbi:MAG TPA: hypothetical protein H9761_08385 [Candidatus Eisenbergiella merdavium]|uniref:Uncharacterized protein n=1 Tax=Candidatus Eisenbergiella merdavium TaxID=2838551 RepID=A0A9D2NFE4_9FIRM|nr:hypothetical protein [Candidatus Eisenbergiella merdavium]